MFTPSVNRIITFDLAWLSLIRLTAFANPRPIAVPSWMIPGWTSLKRFNRTVWSVVNGHCVKLSAANTTNPILSFGRPLIKADATSLDASRRFGFKSCAIILVEISIASTMSMPSVEEFCQLLVDCGRANITIRTATAAIRKMKGTCLSQTFQELAPGASKPSVDDTCKLA